MSTTIMSNEQLADWLERLDSHTVYPEGMLGELPADVRRVVPTQSYEQVQRLMAGDGFGSYLLPDTGVRLFTGYVAAINIAMHRLGRNPAAQLLGRSAIHRACIQALRGA